jgi:hypothetical protein
MTSVTTKGLIVGRYVASDAGPVHHGFGGLRLACMPSHVQAMRG